jgi:phosphatidate cytidylyltransferase
MDKKRIIIALSIGSILVALFTTIPCNTLFGLIGMMLFAGLATWEFYGLLNAIGIEPSKKIGTLSGILFIAATWYSEIGILSDSLLWSVFILLILANLFRVLAYENLRKGLENCMGTILGLVYVPLLWSFVVRLFLSGDLTKPGWAAFYVILCMKLSDSGGYFFGMRFGKHKLAPAISPKKSWEGLWGGIVFCGIANAVWYFVGKGQINSAIPLTPLHAITLSLLFPIIGTIGDLVESLFKRAVEVKDSNTMVYGLGGVLDMVDSILFAAPFLYIYVELVLFN